MSYSHIPYYLDFLNNKLGLGDSYEKHSASLLIEVLVTFTIMDGYAICMKCDEFEQYVDETNIDELIAHLKSHQAKNPTNQGTFLKGAS